MAALLDGFALLCSVKLVLVNHQYLFVFTMVKLHSSFSNRFFLSMDQQRLMQIELVA